MCFQLWLLLRVEPVFVQCEKHTSAQTKGSLRRWGSGGRFCRCSHTRPVNKKGLVRRAQISELSSRQHMLHTNFMVVMVHGRLWSWRQEEAGEQRGKVTTASASGSWGLGSRWLRLYHVCYFQVRPLLTATWLRREVPFEAPKSPVGNVNGVRWRCGVSLVTVGSSRPPPPL